MAQFFTPAPALAVLAIAIPLGGLALRMALRLAYGVRGPDRQDRVYPALLLLSRLMIWFGLIAVTIASLFTLLIVVLAVAGAALEYVMARRALERNLAWSLVGHAQAEGHDVPRVIDSQEDRFTGSVLNDLRGFVWQLRRGDSLPEAVGVWHKAFPREAQGYAAIGKRDGRLWYEPKRPAPIGEGLAPGLIGYLLWILCTAIVVLIFSCGYLLPSLLTNIYSDFSMALPPVTQSLIAGEGPASGGGLAFLLAMLLLALILGATTVFVCQLAGFPVSQPLLDRLFFEQRRAFAIRLLAIAAEQRTPMVQAMHDLAMGHPRFPAANVANRLIVAYRASATGADWKQGLTGAGLLNRSETPLLSSAEQAGNLPWALRALADRAEARSRFRWQAIGKMLFPMAIVLLGAFVLWVCVALFSPLVQLIEGLA